jgi:hypothetical protein
MGTYTNNLKLYKPDPDEFVDVDVQLNANWNITDRIMKQLLEYEYVTATVPDVTDSIGRARFYKAYSNSVTTYFKSGNFFIQGDDLAFVSTWQPAKSFLQAGWIELPEMPMYYRLIKKPGGSPTEVEWSGAFTNNDQVTIDVNVVLNFFDVGAVPLAARPANNKYFNVNAGNTATNYSFARVIFGTDGAAQIKRYGSNPTSPGTENRIELTGIKYALEAQ